MTIEESLNEMELDFLHKAEGILKEEWEEVQSLINAACLSGKINGFVESDLMKKRTVSLTKRSPGSLVGFMSIALRDLFIPTYGYPLWDDNATEIVKKFSKNILSVGSGAGFVESFLEKGGIDIVATDIDAYEIWKKSFVRVEKLSAYHAIKKYPEKDLFISWPTNKSLWALEAVQNLKKGKYIFLISDIGCCAAEAFYDYLYNKRIVENILSVYIPSWEGLMDNLYIFRKR